MVVYEFLKGLTDFGRNFDFGEVLHLGFILKGLIDFGGNFNFGEVLHFRLVRPFFVLRKGILSISCSLGGYIAHP